jgi:hypothetical protein
MKKKIKISKNIFSLIFPSVSYDEYMNMPRKKKKKHKHKLEKQFNSKFKLWLQDYERKHRISRILP